MFKNFLFFLDKPATDVLSDRVDKEEIVGKHWFNLGMSIACLLVTVVLGLVSLLRYENKEAPITFGVNMHAKTQQQLNILPYPHQSFNNVSSWIVDAVTAAYTFNFNQYDAQVERAAYYFTADGYSTYLNALVANKIKENVVGRKLQISVIPLQDPAISNGGIFGTTEFWRFKMPILISYYGGKDPVVQKVLVEVLVLRVPSHQNYKGLAIAEFNMVPM